MNKSTQHILIAVIVAGVAVHYYHTKMKAGAPKR